MSGTVWQSLFAAGILVILGMVATWFFALRLKNFGIVDAVWSFLFAPVSWIYVLSGDGWQARRMVVAVTVTLWSLRLGIHLARRIAFHHPEEDRRYAALRREWGEVANLRMLGFYLLQGGLIVVLSVPFLLPTMNTTPGIAYIEWLGLALFAAGLAGESLADSQLAKGRREGDVVCRRGLWNYSRHPNYFFEWIVWVGFALFASASEMGWLAWVSPMLMLHFLLNVTGIPMTEDLSVQRKGEAYLEYQRTTSPFVPWFRKTL
ncbi:MAG: DUF1295 domain-containing protein [Verrucomicrobiae bacterium]|jgi:steroid 5-alpha reductase family enzyme|nr:DUF1295 domain-containing protein [Verrucomicrobiae bacterium]